VQVATRSGTNKFHGNLFEFNRNDAFNANDWFNNRSGLPRELLKRNQFGASLCGPIVKNDFLLQLAVPAPRPEPQGDRHRAHARSAQRHLPLHGRRGELPTQVDGSGQPLVPAAAPPSPRAATARTIWSPMIPCARVSTLSRSCRSH
jgi:hypothetical protein